MSIIRAGCLLVLLLLAPSVWAQNPHPRIWLDSATMTQLHALVAANDPTWIALKADADAYVAETVPAYDRNACGANQICYTYEGSGYLDALEKLALAYKMTGNTAYSNQAKAILNALVAAGLPPEQVDSGYPSRNIVLGLALAYDWCYDQLSASEKMNYTNLLDTWWTWVQASGYQWNCSSGACPTAYGNYFSGHLLGFGLAALAVEGDDTNAAAIETVVLNNFNAYVVPAFTTGGFSGGYAVESYNYGGNTFLRLFQYMRGMTTAGKTDLFNSYMSWVKQVAKNTLYEVRPDHWSITDEGTWSGDYARVFYRSFPYDMSGFLNGTTEGGWLKQLFNSLATPPAPTPASLYVPGTFDLFLYKNSQSPIDYTATQPTSFFSPVDEHTIVRNDWTASAVHTTFRGGTVGVYADHEQRAAGHITIQRGSDYLLITAGQWDGATGLTGQPSTYDQASWHVNTLFYWDGGTNCLDQDSNGGQYAGCQMFWGTPNSVNHKEGTGYTFQEAPLQNAYLDNHGNKTISEYVRSFVNIGGDVDFVFDRITAPSSSTRKLEWHTPALASATPPGNATEIALNGNIASATVGNSKIWIKTLLPASPTLNRMTDVITWDVTTLMGTQRFEVSDPNASSCSTNCPFLTVLSPTASSVAAMPATTLITATGYDGAIYDDGTLPRVALFSVDDRIHSSVTYTASYSAGLTGRRP